MQTPYLYTCTDVHMYVGLHVHVYVAVNFISNVLSLIVLLVEKDKVGNKCHLIYHRSWMLYKRLIIFGIRSLASQICAAQIMICYDTQNTQSYRIANSQTWSAVADYVFVILQTFLRLVLYMLKTTTVSHPVTRQPASTIEVLFSHSILQKSSVGPRQKWEASAPPCCHFLF